MITTFSIFIYLLRLLLLGLATGTAFVRLGLFKLMPNGQTMLIGIAATPMFVSMIDYLLGLVFVGWSKWFYFLMPIVLPLAFLATGKRFLKCIDACRKIWNYCIVFVKSIGGWMIFDSFVAVAIALFFFMKFNGVDLWTSAIELFHAQSTIGLLTIGLFGTILFLILGFFVHRMIKSSTLLKNFFLILLLIVTGTETMHAVSMIDRPIVDSDRSHYELDARYFVEDKNAWEVDCYTDEKYGSSHPDDHGPLWILYLADARIVAESTGMADALKCENIAVFWVFLCFNLLLFIFASYGSETYRAGATALILFHIYTYSFLMILGSRDAFRFVGLLLLVIYVLNQIEAISTGQVKWYEYAALSFFCYLSMNGHEGNVYIMLGLFIVVGILLLTKKAPVQHLITCGISVLTGTLLGITKTIQTYLTTGRLASSSLLPFYNTPVEEQIAAINNNRADRTVIWTTYTLHVKLVILLGMIGLFLMIAVSWKNKEKKTLAYSMLVLGMLLPLTGIMDWIGYEVSLWFVEQRRYRMYFLMLLATTGAWLLTRRSRVRILYYIALAGCVLGVLAFLNAENQRCTDYSRHHLEVCIGIRQSYERMAELVESVTDGDAFTRDQALLYYLHGTPKLLYHPYSKTLIQAKTDKEIETAIEELNVGAILLPKNGLEYHDYSLLPFWDYINNDKHFSQISPEEGNYKSDKIIFYKNSESAD